MTTMPFIGRIALWRAAKELWKDAETPKRAEHFRRAYQLLKTATFELDSNELSIESASERGKTYRVVGGNCHCDGWKHREQCWHSDAWRIVNLGYQLTEAERKAAEAELWGE
jgi:hypothetical protein